MNSCQIGSLTYKYAYYLQNGRKEADSLFCKLSWLVAAQPIIDSYIPVGTLISTPAVNACGVTNTIVGFAPIPPIVEFHSTVFNYNGNPLTTVNAATLLLFMDTVVAELTTASGVQWSYTQLSDFEFRLCAPYTQNGDTVDLTIEAFSEASVGNITMTVTLSGGVAPATPEYATDATNCNITSLQHDNMVATANWIVKGVKCCDIPRPVKEICSDENPSDANKELREDLNDELRESAN